MPALFHGLRLGVVRSAHRRPWRALGLDSRTALYHALWSSRIALGVVSVPVGFSLLLRLHLSDVHRELSAPLLPVWSGQVGGYIARILLWTVGGPVFEEVVFRGLAYGPLSRRLGPAGATFGSAALWALEHYGLSTRSMGHILVVFVLGVVYAEAYRRRESLVPPVVFHIVENTTAIVLRDGHLITHIAFAGASICLWIGSAVLFHVICRSRTPKKDPGVYAGSV